MAGNGPNSKELDTNEKNAGEPVRGPAQEINEAELDARQRDKENPRKSSGPPLGDDNDGEQIARSPHEPPPATDPDAEENTAGRVVPDGSDETWASEAGTPVDHVSPKPSTDELNRRDRKKAAPRRAAGPPLDNEGTDDAQLDGQFHQPPPATDPET